MKKTLLLAVLIILSAFTACEDINSDAFSDVTPKVKYYGYVTTTSSLYSYNILEDGSFQQIGAPVTGLASPQRIAVHPSGDYIYVAEDGSILCYKTCDDGALTPLAPLVNSVVNENLVVHPSGRYLYVTSSTSSANYIYIYNINQDGSLAYNSITSGGAGISYGIAVNPSGTRVFVTRGNGNQIISYGVTNTGILNDAKPYVPGGTPGALGNLVVHPSGNYLYCAAADNSVAANILSDGSLTSLSGTLTFPAHSDINLHPSGKYLYSTDNALYSGSCGILDNGDFVRIQPDISIMGTLQNNIAVHPKGTYVYITSSGSNSSLVCYSSDSVGSLSFNRMTAKTAQLPVDVKIVSKTVYGEN